MKTIKKFLLIITIVMLVMATGIHVALGEPTPTSTPASSPTPPPSEEVSPDATDTDTASTEPGTTFVTLKSGSSGEAVIRLQMRLRQLGYFNYRATGMYLGMTEGGVKQYQEQNDLSADGQAGEQTYNDMFTTDAVRKPLSMSIVPVHGELDVKVNPVVYGELSSWAEVDAVFTVGATVTVTDFNTGATFQMQRTGGTNHANVEPPDSANYDSFVNVMGGDLSWEKRAVLVEIGGVKYAGSIFGNPSGEDTLGEANGMKGHTEIYFNGSTSDFFGFTDRYHQEKVLIAAGQIQ